MANSHRSPTAESPDKPLVRRPGWQGETLVLAGVIWSLWPVPTIAALLAAYVLGLIAANWLLPRMAAPGADGGGGSASAGATSPISIGSRRWWILLAVIPLVAGAKTLRRWEPASWWSTLSENVGDRLYLERTPAIMPRLLVSCQPQRFFIAAPGSEKVDVRWTPQSAPLPSENLGSGLFMLDYNPRRDATLAETKAGLLEVQLIVDGRSHARQLELAHPLPHPRWFHSTPQRGLAATVSEETDELILVRRDGTHRRVDVDDGPSDCVFFEGGRRLAVAHRYARDLWIVDSGTGETVAKIPLGLSQTRLAVAPDDSLLAIAVDGVARGIHLVTTSDGVEAGFIPLPFSPDWLQFGRDENELVVTDRRAHTVVRVRRRAPTASDADANPDPRDSSDGGDAVPGETDLPSPEPNATSWRIVEPRIVLTRPVVTLGRSADGQTLLLASTAATVGRLRITANHFVENAIHHLDLARWRITHSERTDRRGLRQDGAGDTEHGVSPMGIAPLGEKFLVAYAGSNEVAEMTRDPGARVRFHSLARHSLFAPHGVADLGEGVWCVASPSSGTIGVFREGNLAHLIALTPTEEELARDDPAALERRRGEQDFYEGTRAGLACQSCHLHLGPDYSQHNIGQDVDSDSLTIRGIAGTSPYLRDGSNSHLRALHDVTESIYRGYRRPVPWDRRTALAAFLRGLPGEVNPRQLEPPDLPRLQAGHAAFRKAECHHCHAPPAMTNLSQHPVRQLFPDYFQDQETSTFSDDQPFVDTPSLRGVSLHPPYLHDARAQTLVDVLVESNRPNRHGNVKSLAPGELDDLLYFLGEL